MFAAMRRPRRASSVSSPLGAPAPPRNRRKASVWNGRSSQRPILNAQYPKFLSIMLEVSAMRPPLAVTIISIAMLASPLAYGQAVSGKGQPSGPAVGGGDRISIPPTPPAIAPAIAPVSDALSNLAGGGYADPNYMPPGTHSKKR